MTIRLDDRWYEPVQSGNKTSTIRKGSELFKQQRGQTRLVFESHDPIAVTVDSIEGKQYRFLKPRHAEDEGLESVDELKNVLSEYYDLEDRTTLTIIRFSVINPEPDVDPSTAQPRLF